MPAPFDEVHVREILLRDKGFLYDLFKNGQLKNKTTIAGAHDMHLDTLITICHLIVNNEIPLFEVEGGHDKLSPSRKRYLKDQFEDNRSFVFLLEGPRPKKVEALQRL